MDKNSLHIVIAEMSDLTKMAKPMLDSMLDLKVCYKSLSSIKTHMYIASYKWSNLIVEIDENAPLNDIAIIATKCDKVSFILKCVISNDILALLCKTNIEVAGELRRAFMRGRDITNLVNIRFEIDRVEEVENIE